MLRFRRQIKIIMSRCSFTRWLPEISENNCATLDGKLAAAKVDGAGPIRCLEPTYVGKPLCRGRGRASVHARHNDR